MSSIGSNQSSKSWELLSIAECESSGLLVTFFMAWSPGRRFNAGDSRLITRRLRHPKFLPTQRRDHARTATAVFFEGGRQWRLVEARRRLTAGLDCLGR